MAHQLTVLDFRWRSRDAELFEEPHLLRAFVSGAVLSAPLWALIAWGVRALAR